MARSGANSVITPESFSLSPAVMGLPLARPSRRLAAMLLDLLLVAVLVNLGGVLLAIAAALVAFRLAGRLAPKWSGPLIRVARGGVRAVGAIVLFVVALNLWEGAAEWFTGWGDNVTVSVDDSDGTRVSAANAIRAAPAVIRLQNAPTEAEARRAAPEVMTTLRGAGLSREEAAEVMREMADDAEQPWMPAVVTDALQAGAPATVAALTLRTDSLAGSYAAAMAAGDSGTAKQLEPVLAARLAHDTLARMDARIDQLGNQLAEARREVEEHRNEGMLSWLRRFLDEMGIGFGWTGLYFTAFLALWKGQTPGKRLLGLRVVRLNGEPMNLWTSFERFGGYAAGLVTGLLGFAQVFWDRNRQMIHDKIVETVVVREQRSAR
jgi:hypothetical protein